MILLRRLTWLRMVSKSSLNPFESQSTMTRTSFFPAQKKKNNASLINSSSMQELHGRPLRRLHRSLQRICRLHRSLQRICRLHQRSIHRFRRLRRPLPVGAGVVVRPKRLGPHPAHRLALGAHLVLVADWLTYPWKNGPRTSPASSAHQMPAVGPAGIRRI